MKINLPNKYHVQYDEYQKDPNSGDEYIHDYCWMPRSDEYDTEAQASLAAINLVVERDKFKESTSDLRSCPQEGAVRNVKVTEETRAEEVLRVFDYSTIMSKMLEPVRSERPEQ
ncbi:hypothetical protein MAINES_00260 [Brevundimonas phage vB_BpoS-MaInes]|nr:hypothetical protein MAINES_00260 [Brevundimonas phage vB_BpoS-MaInes]